MRRPKAGETVWLRYDLVVGVKYGWLTYLNSMKKGRLVTVKGKLHAGDFTIGEDFLAIISK